MTIAIEQQTIPGNLLLGQLAVHERNAIHRAAEAVSLAAGDSLLRANTQWEAVFFPINCVASVVRTLRDGSAMELALIGNEGLVGLGVFTGSRTQLDDAVVQSAGWAYRIPTDELRNQLRRGGGLQKSLLRFVDTLFAQVAQTAVCARFHAPEARLARWLLMIHQRTASAEILTTPVALRTALMLEPDGIATAIKRLAAAGAIAVRPDTITIKDREGLEVRACECYETLRQEYERTLAS
ncbi:MAG TPA: Crp/Fnr family transcriptional regulator [Thermoanaerobaculia bacterium]|nr:Crp/Fnr family transcriptional regulator [Thermoanaerobaculia bacterium]